MNGFVFAVLCVAVLPLVMATPVAEQPGDHPVLSFLRVRRQSPASCSNDQDCLADPTLQQPSADLVQCENGGCVCSDCFMLNSIGTCSVSCMTYGYNNASSVCGQDTRPTQLTAFLLTIFLSYTGAANFYIGQNGIGGGQIAMLLIIMTFSYLMCCFPCCLACCMGSEDVKGSCIFIILMLLSTVLVICASFAISAWYIADVIIFATNQRPAGDGCILRPWQ